MLKLPCFPPLGWKDVTPYANCCYSLWKCHSGLIEIIDDGHTTARITSKGVNSLTLPQQGVAPSQTINAGVYVSGDMKGGMVTGRDIQQANTVNQNDLRQLAEFVASVRKHLAELNLPPNDADDLAHDLTSIELQLKKQVPNPGIIAGIFSDVKNKLKECATSAIVAGITMSTNDIWVWLSQHSPINCGRIRDGNFYGVAIT